MYILFLYILIIYDVTKGMLTSLLIAGCALVLSSVATPRESYVRHPWLLFCIA